MLFRICGLTLLLFIFVMNAHAEDESAPSAQAQAVPKDEYDFSWLDPDKKIYVVQNRKFTKEMRLEVNLSYGVGLAQAYNTTRTILPRASFYINEHWGVSVFGGFNTNTTNDNYVNLKAVSSVIPTVRTVKSFTSGSVLWIPFYGKINIFNQIFYLDWDFEVGLGTLLSDIDLNTRSNGTSVINESSFTEWHWGTGQRFFVTRNFSVRFDYLTQYYTAPVALSGVITGTTSGYSNSYFVLGVGYTF